MIANLRRLIDLPAQERRLLVQAWMLLLGIDLGLRLLRFSTLQRILRRGRKQSPAAPADVEGLIRGVSLAVARAARHHLYPMTCLRRSLALQWMLARRGIGAELRFGVQSIEEREGIRAHAWLEFNGRPIAEPEALTGRFARLAGKGL